VVKSRAIKLVYVLYVACVKEMRNACNLSVGKIIQKSYEQLTS